MSAASAKFSQPTLWDIPSAISSLGEDSGASLSGRPDGLTAVPYGPEAAPAPVSAQREKARGLETLVTSGLIGRDSSASAALQQSLESRLMPLLDTAGSTLFKLTWKRRRTPLGRWYLEHAASALRTSGHDSTLPLSWWSTPDNCERGGTKPRPGRSLSGEYLQRQVHLASWPTTTTRDWKDGSECPNVPIKCVAGTDGVAGRLADNPEPGWESRRRVSDESDGRGPTRIESGRLCAVVTLADTESERERTDQSGRNRREAEQLAGAEPRSDSRHNGPVNGFWANAEWIWCRDEKFRPVEPGTFPLAAGYPARVGLLRLAGDAINVEAARTFIEAAKEAINDYSQIEER